MEIYKQVLELIGLTAAAAIAVMILAMCVCLMIYALKDAREERRRKR